MGFLSDLGKMIVDDAKHNMEKFQEDYEKYSDWYSERSDEQLIEEWKRQGSSLRGGRRQAIMNEMENRGLGHRR